MIVHLEVHSTPIRYKPVFGWRLGFSWRFLQWFRRLWRRLTAVESRWTTKRRSRRRGSGTSRFGWFSLPSRSGSLNHRPIESQEIVHFSFKVKMRHFFPQKWINLLQKQRTPEYIFLFYSSSKRSKLKPSGKFVTRFWLDNHRKKAFMIGHHLDNQKQLSSW